MTEFDSTGIDLQVPGQHIRGISFSSQGQGQGPSDKIHYRGLRPADPVGANWGFTENLIYLSTQRFRVALWMFDCSK